MIINRLIYAIALSARVPCGVSLLISSVFEHAAVGTRG